MIRKVIRASLFVALGGVAVVLSYAAASNAQDKKGDKIMAIDEIMTKVHSKKGFFKSLATAVKGEKWEDAGKYSKDLTTAATDLGKNTPPKGEKKSWETLTKKYAESAKAIADGIEKKDAKAATTGLSAIGTSCKGCHDNHK